MNRVFVFVLCAFVPAAWSAAPAMCQSEPRLFNTIRFDAQKVFDGITQLSTSDIWSPHNLNYTFDPAHLEERLDLLVPLDDPEQFINADIERLTYADGHRVNRETPEDFYTAITNIKALRPDNPAALDGGLPVSWTRLIARDEETTEYAHHESWIKESERWRPAIEAADYWTSSHYRDGRPQYDWIERLEVFHSLFSQQFPGKPLTIVIWHRERVGPDRTEEWITMEDYIEMGITARDLGCHVIAFGREDNPDRVDYERAMKYFAELEALWDK